MAAKDIITSPEYRSLEMEFDRFVYAVSHDFSAPLRHIREFHLLLLDKLADKITDDETLYVNIIKDSLNEMQQMLDSLLEISRIASANSAPEPLDTAEILAQALQPFEADIKQHQIKVTIDKKLPNIHGSSEQITRLFFELISNAIMFRNMQKQPTLHISAKKKGNKCQLTFADNGIGIARHFQDDAFTIFRKLHTHPHHEGLGTGLSLCQSVVRHLGGEIWFESTPEEGTSFHLSLPTC